MMPTNRMQREPVADPVAGDLFAEPDQEEHATHHRCSGRQQEPAAGLGDEAGNVLKTGRDAEGLECRKQQRQDQREAGNLAAAGLTRSFERTQPAPHHCDKLHGDRDAQIGNDGEREDRNAGGTPDESSRPACICGEMPASGI